MNKNEYGGRHVSSYAELMDHFPLTGDIQVIVSRHVETVCLLSKLQQTRQHIEVRVDMDEMDVTAAESRATYEQIRDWVQENYGLHVTNLNIAQVKRKHGFDLRENFNKPKTPDQQVLVVFFHRFPVITGREKRIVERKK